MVANNSQQQFQGDQEVILEGQKMQPVVEPPFMEITMNSAREVKIMKALSVVIGIIIGTLLFFIVAFALHWI